jgi:hypothetical protein
MGFVKLDCGILDSTLWLERDSREVFLTALLMAEPFELREDTPQIQVASLDLTGWVVPSGWYGFVAAAGIGILHRAKVPDAEGMVALERLGSPEASSRSPDFEGRRLVRVNGGFIVLNYMKYRERDYTSAERSKRYRERLVSSRRVVTPSHRDITQAEAEAEAEAEADHEKIKPIRAKSALAAGASMFDTFWQAYPRKVGKGQAEKAWLKLNPDGAIVGKIMQAIAWQANQPGWTKDGGKFIPHPTTWLNGKRWEDEPFNHPNGNGNNDAVWNRVLKGGPR